jgi:hypothetical protein
MVIVGVTVSVFVIVGVNVAVYALTGHSIAAMDLSGKFDIAVKLPTGKTFFPTMVIPKTVPNGSGIHVPSAKPVEESTQVRYGDATAPKFTYVKIPPMNKADPVRYMEYADELKPGSQGSIVPPISNPAAPVLDPPLTDVNSPTIYIFPLQASIACTFPLGAGFHPVCKTPAEESKAPAWAHALVPLAVVNTPPAYTMPL